MTDLRRFIEAQADPDSGFAAALAEIRAGRKRGHWIWYVFPQLRGLGLSPTSVRFAIEHPAEARDYLRDARLRSRLLAITSELAARLRAGATLEGVMGSAIDTSKVVSSLTLFGALARSADDPSAAQECSALAEMAEEVLRAAERQGYERCPFTLAALAAG